ncbi:MAG: DUF4238 domain-containing protein [Acidimicrobiales bacterium]
MSPRRHHIVSAGYQRHFADGELVRHWLKADNSWSRPIGVRDSFVEEGFNSVFTPDPATIEALEKEWARIEGSVIPAIDAAERGDRSPGVAHALKAVIAMHYCRSYSHRIVSEQTIEILRTQGIDLPRQPDMVEAFEAQFGHPPEPGEMEARYELLVAATEASRVLFVGGMTRIYGKVMEILRPLHLQIGVPFKRDIGLLFGDTPVVVQSGVKVGVREGVAIGNCELVYMPLSRWTAMSLSAAPRGDGMMGPAQVQKMNLLMRRNCRDRLAAHPCEDIPRALGMNAPPDWPPNDHPCT